MAVTRIADIIEPEVFAAYVREEIIEKSALIRSGIITQNSQLNQLVSGGGRTINLPFWKRLAGTSEVLSDANPLTPLAIGTAKDVAVMHLRGNAWAANELASAIAGDSAMAAISSMVTEYWLRDEQRTLISTLNGAFASSTMTSEHVRDNGNPISAEEILDAKQLLGDAADQLSAIIVHSKTYTDMQKKNLIEVIPDARGEVAFQRFLTYDIIVDDTVPNDGNEFYTYLLANGVIARGDGNPVDLTPVETDRDSLAGVDYLIHRRAFVMHPMGIRWLGTNVAGEAPTNAELEDGGNWERVADRKHVGMVLLKHTLGN